MISLTFPSSKAETNSLQLDTSRLFSEVALRVRIERRASAGALSVDLSSFSATSALPSVAFAVSSLDSLADTSLSDFGFSVVTCSESEETSVAFAVSSLDSLADTSDFSDFGLSVAPFSESEEISVVSGVTTALSATVGFESAVSGAEDSDGLFELPEFADNTEIGKVCVTLASSALATCPLKKKAVPKRTDAKPKLYFLKEKRWRSLK